MLDHIRLLLFPNLKIKICICYYNNKKNIVDILKHFHKNLTHLNHEKLTLKD